MNKLEVVAQELKKLDAFCVASICSSLLVLLAGSRSTLKSLDHIRWAENRLLGARDSALDLMQTPRAAAISRCIDVALLGIGELRKEIGKAA